MNRSCGFLASKLGLCAIFLAFDQAHLIHRGGALNPETGEPHMTIPMIKYLPVLFIVAVLSFVIPFAGGPGPAEAGKKKYNFGGQHGPFKYKHYKGDTYNHKAGARARANAKARARAKAKARAAAKAKAKQRALAAQRQKALTKAKDTRPTESNSAAVPSTAAALTQSDLNSEAETRVKPSLGNKVDVATSSEEPTLDTESSASSIGDGACKKFLPEVGTAVAIPCD